MKCTRQDERVWNGARVVCVCVCVCYTTAVPLLLPLAASTTAAPAGSSRSLTSASNPCFSLHNSPSLTSGCHEHEPSSACKDKGIALLPLECYTHTHTRVWCKWMLPKGCATGEIIVVVIVAIFVLFLFSPFHMPSAADFQGQIND
jgi:hypothetical protein